MNERQLKKEIAKLEHELREIERVKMDRKIDVIDNALKAFCNKHPLYTYIYQDDNTRKIKLDSMYTFNKSKDVVTINIYRSQKYIYINLYDLEIKYWEHAPGYKHPGTSISLCMADDYLKGRLLKLFEKIHQWHRSRPLHEKYKALKHTTY